MAIKKVKKGDKVEVKIELEFEGNVNNHVILIEGEHIPTSNNTAKENVELDGDPIEVESIFKGTNGSKIKKYTLEINGRIREENNLKIKQKKLRLVEQIPYSFFDLKEDENEE